MEKMDSDGTLLSGINRSSSKVRILTGLTGLLAIASIGLIIALVVVANNNNKNKDKGHEQHTGLDCPLTTESNVDKAKCILDSYPLIDGQVFHFYYYYFLFVMHCFITVNAFIFF